MQDIKIGIVGAGAVGTVFAVCLSCAGYNVEVSFKNKDFQSENDKCDFYISGAFGDKKAQVPFCINENFECKKDIIFVLTKAPQALGLVKVAVNKLNENGIIVAVNNTLNIDELLEVVPKEKLLSMFIEWACEKNRPRCVHVYKGGDIHLGCFCESADPLMQIVKKILSNISDVIVEQDIVGFVISRNILNCALTSMGALTGLSAGQFLELKKGRKIFCKLIIEGYNVFKYFGIKIPAYNDQLNYSMFCDSGFSGVVYRGNMIKTIMRNNYDLRSSMLYCLQNNLETENSFKSGKIAQIGENKQIEIYYNKKIAQLIDEISNGKRKIGTNNLSEF